MKKLLVALILLNLSVTGYVNAQTRPFGKIDTADLKLTSCGFEKTANAMVLFDKAVVTYKYASIVMERHRRIKIFNDNGKEAANIRVEYYGAHRDETISEITAETINLNGKTIEYTPVEKNLIYTEVIDKERTALVFTFPNVKAGSVIEFKYTFSTPYPHNFPDWYFQSKIPARYSEFDASFNIDYNLDILKTIYQPLFKDTSMLIGKKTNPKGSRFIWAMANVMAYKEEPYMDYPDEYLQRIEFRSNYHAYPSWPLLGVKILQDEDFGDQLNVPLAKEDEILNKANKLKTTNEKIAYIFDTVKRAMTWDKKDLWYTDDGVKKAWNKKIGNSTEINLILYHLLTMANINCSLAVLKTRENGRMSANYPTFEGLNKTVVYCAVDTLRYYILDATDPYNVYNNVPADINGLNALLIDPANKTYRLIPLKGGEAKEAITIDGNISADGKLQGDLQISSTNERREQYLREYKELGEKKYIIHFEKANDGLKILALKLENVENDTLALNQRFNFTFNLADPEENYIYFNPNELSSFRDNPFLSETRIADIELGSLFTYSINGRYKIPERYKISILPKSLQLIMPDKSIVFKRITGEQDGMIITYYYIDFKKSTFSKNEYPLLHDFYKKMHEMLDEQIVLKKL